MGVVPFEKLRGCVDSLRDINVQEQPAGIDLTLAKVFGFLENGQIDFENKERILPRTQEIVFDKDGWVLLQRGCYKVQYNEIVKIPPDYVAIGYTRSSLLRCGAFIATALWDPGYEGRSESLLVVENPYGIRLKKDARILQLVFVRLEKRATRLYQGKYKGENIGDEKKRNE